MHGSATHQPPKPYPLCMTTTDGLRLTAATVQRHSRGVRQAFVVWPGRVLTSRHMGAVSKAHWSRPGGLAAAMALARCAPGPEPRCRPPGISSRAGRCSTSSTRSAARHLPSPCVLLHKYLSLPVHAMACNGRRRCRWCAQRHPAPTQQYTRTWRPAAAAPTPTPQHAPHKGALLPL